MFRLRGFAQNLLGKGWQSKLDTIFKQLPSIASDPEDAAVAGASSITFPNLGFLESQEFWDFCGYMAHMDMPLTGADVTQSFHSLWIKKHLERVKNKQLRHESSEVVMSLYIRICHFHVHLAIMFWMTFWLEGLPWDYGVSYTSQVATLYNLQPSNVTMNLVLSCLKVPKGSTQSHPHGTPLPLCRLRIGNLFWTLLIPKEPNGLNFHFFFLRKTPRYFTTHR